MFLIILDNQIKVKNMAINWLKVYQENKWIQITQKLVWMKVRIKMLHKNFKIPIGSSITFWRLVADKEGWKIASPCLFIKKE